MTSKPIISDEPLYLLLKDRQVAEFNRRWEAGERGALRGLDYSGMDLRGLEAHGLDLRDGSFHDADLRGVDLRQANLEGATLHRARIAGVYFPPELTPDEIELSLLHGTRLRYRR